MSRIFTAIACLLTLALPKLGIGQCAGFSFTVNDSTVCIPQVVQFSVTGNPPAGTTYRWDFGSGFNTGLDTISKLYLVPGKYDVRLELSFPNNSKCVVTKRDFIEVGRKPIVNLTIDKQVICNAGDSVFITDSTPNSMTRDYIIEGVRYNNLEVISSFQFSNSPGSRDISAIVTDSLGCETVENFVDFVTVAPEFTFDFSTDSTNGCTNRYANFKYEELISGQEPIQFDWEFENATPSISNDSNPSNIFYSSEDSSDVKLSVTTLQGCVYTLEKENWMTLADPINLSINVTQSDPCVGGDIRYYVSNSQSGQVTWQFFPNDFEIQQISDTSITGEHRTAGGKIVRASQQFKGCISQTDSRNQVNVKGPESRFIADKTISCNSQETVQFTNTSVEPPGEIVTYKWLIKDSNGVLLDSALTTDHTYTFNGFGEYNITLICFSDKNGCSDTLEKVGMIKLRRIEIQTEIESNIACLSQGVMFKSNTPLGSSSTPNIYKWEIFDSDGTLIRTSSVDSFEHVFAKTGKYDYSLVVSNALGCKDSAYFVDSVEVIKPSFDFIFSDSSVCKNETITVNAEQNKELNDLVYFWRFENETYSGISRTLLGDSGDVKFPVPGTYSYQFIYFAKIGPACKDTFEKSGFIKVSGTDITINTSNDDDCPIMNTSLTSSIDRTQNYKNTQSSFDYLWRGSDTCFSFSTPTQANTNAAISGKGIKKAKLVYTDLSGCQDSTNWLDHYVGVIANFQATPQACLKGTTLLTSLSSLNPERIKWQSDSSGITFGPDDTSKNVNVSFSREGTFPITLIAYKKTCSDTFTENLTVVDIRAAFYSPQPINQCAPAVVEFIDTSNNPNITQRIWSFGDGTVVNTGAQKVATHVYTKNTDTSGVNIQLIVRNNYGCADTLTKPGYIRVLGPIPGLELINASGCESLNVKFNNTSKYYSRVFVEYGDGSTLDSTTVFQHTYNISDENNLGEYYKPKMVLYDNSGCFVDFSPEDSIYVLQNAIADFEMESDTGCESFRASFINQSRRAFSYEWDFDNDGSIDNTNESPIAFYNAGKHYPVLIAKSPTGCYDTLRNHRELYVYDKPKAQFDVFPDTTCYQFPVYVFDQSTEGQDSADIVSWFYDFGEEFKIFDTASTPNANYSYTYIGNNLITYTVSDANGCVDSVKKFVHIRDTLNPENNGISYITVKDNQDIEVNWLKSQLSIFKQYDIYEDEANVLTNVYNSNNINDTTLLLQNGLDVNARRYCYTTRITDTCLKIGPPIKSHCNIYLRALDTFLNANQLRWTHYEGWDRRLSYEVYRKHPDSSDFSRIATLNGSQNVYVDDSLCDINYCYYIICTHINGVWKTQSNNACNTPKIVPPQDAPIIDYVTVRGKELSEVKWHMPPHQAILDYYTIYRSEGASGPAGRIIGQSNMSIYFDNKIKTEVSPFTYRVQTTDICGYKSPLSTPSNTIHLGGENINDTVLITWNPYIFWNKGVSNYIIEMRDKNYELNEIARVNGSTTNFSINSLDLEISDSLCFRVIALEDSTVVDSSFSNIRCIAPKSRVFVPNAFTPNNDGLNDLFKPVSIFLYNDKGNTVFDYTFQIFNRWGEKVFATDEVDDAWDGTYKGKAVQGGVYLWRVDALGLDGVYHTYSGRVTLIR